MKRLIVVRHAHSPAPASPLLRDFDRPLDDRGRIEGAELGRFLVERAIRPEEALVSAARRTRESWDLLAPLCDPGVAVSFREDLYSAGADELLESIRGVEGDPRTVLLLGHNPGVHELSIRLAGRREGFEDLGRLAGFPPASAAVIDLPLEDWSRIRFGTGTCFALFHPSAPG